MSNFEELIARVDTGQWKDDALVHDLYAMLTAKDAEVAELRGLLGEALAWVCLPDHLVERITAALAEKEQPQ